MQTAQTATAPAVAASAPVDVNTLMAALLPLGGLAYAVMKTMSAKMKKSESESLKKSADMIETFVLPALQQNKKFVDKTEVQDVKIEQIAAALYKFMGTEEAEKITDKPEIKQKKLIEDAAIAKKEKEDYAAKVKQVEDLKVKLGLVKAPVVPAAATTTAAPSMVWDEATKSWVSK